MRHRRYVRNGLAALLVLAAVVVLVGFAGRGDGALRSAEPYLVYKDNFTGRYEWPTKSTASVIYGVSPKGTYLIVHKKPPWFVYAGPDAVFDTFDVIDVADSRQKVDLRGDGKGENMTMGLLCRYNGDVKNDTGYAFYLSSRDGPRWAILRLISGDAITLRKGKGSFNLKKWNRLEASCIGDTLTFKVNGRQVAKVRDSRIEKGINALLGVSVSTQKPPLVALFDNYELHYRPV